MAAPSATNVIRSSGALYKNPSDLTSSFGTALGAVAGVLVHADTPSYNVIAEEFDEPAEVIPGGPRVFVAASMRASLDADALAVAFPDVQSGPVVRIPGGVRAGRLGSSSSMVLLFKATKSTDLSFVAYKAIPRLARETEIRFGLMREVTLEVVFECLRDSSGRILHFGALADLAL